MRDRLIPIGAIVSALALLGTLYLAPTAPAPVKRPERQDARMMRDCLANPLRVDQCLANYGRF